MVMFVVLPSVLYIGIRDKVYRGHGGEGMRALQDCAVTLQLWSVLFSSKRLLLARTIKQSAVERYVV